MSDRTERVSEEHADELLELPNVVGTGGGGDDVVVFVKEKKPLSALSTSERVPREIDGVRTRVIEVGEITAKLQAGTSIGLRNGGTGTLGGIVKDEHGNQYALTNNHVAANSNLARVLDTIHSPGNADGLGSRIGNLDRFVPIYFNRPNLVDAALVRLDRAYPATHPQRVLTPHVGWTVNKRGRTTGYNTGKVIARGATFDIDFGSQRVPRFRNQIVTSFMLDSGDSGSVLNSSGGFACALGFAGSYEISIHNPMHLVLRTLAVSF